MGHTRPFGRGLVGLAARNHIRNSSSPALCSCSPRGGVPLSGMGLADAVARQLLCECQCIFHHRGHLVIRPRQTRAWGRPIDAERRLQVEFAGPTSTKKFFCPNSVAKNRLNSDLAVCYGHFSRSLRPQVQGMCRESWPWGGTCGRSRYDPRLQWIDRSWSIGDESDP